ncbi:MAG: hypothetical protein AAFX76_12420, partial [Planctomycetota bacterium]
IDRERLIGAFRHTDRESPFLAYQMDTVLRRLAPGYANATPSRFASELLRDEAEVLDRLLHDAPRCARLYNDAVRAFPGAGVTRLSVEPDRVETPLWAMGWMRPRRRVYVDVADSTPMFVTEDGEPLGAGGGVTLAPRALLMTALLRRPDRCGLFVHGTGGGAYDRITERWWGEWRGEALAPMATATADVRLDFDGLPVAGRADVERAVWRAHHLSHNLDRELGLNDERTRAKRELLDHMHDDRDRRRRGASFRLIHEINRELAEAHPDAIAEADRAVERARVGVANAAVAGKRDWPFLLYPEPTRVALAEQIEARRRRVVSPLG